GPHGSLVKQGDKKMTHIPAFIPEGGIIDETGAGDCYLSAFLSEFVESNNNWYEIIRSAHIGSSAASFLLERKGPYGFGSKKQIEMRILERNIIPSHYENTVKNNNF
ncbi:MAG: PfkB family carbohydrate kinase, partial [Promethearchaeota archaeon]